VYDRYHMN